MNRILITTALILSFHAASTSAAITWTHLEHPSLINKSPGPDELWLTIDDVNDLGGGVGANPLGSAVLFKDGGGPGVDGYLSGFSSSGAPILPLPNVLPGLPGNDSFFLLGIGGPFPAGGPTVNSTLSTWTINADQSVGYDMFFDSPPTFKYVGTGYIFFPGDDAVSLIGPGDLADSIDFLLGLIPVPYEAAIYFTGDFTDLSNVPNGTRLSGLAYTTTIVPVPASVVFLATGFACIGLRRERKRKKNKRTRTF